MPNQFNVSFKLNGDNTGIKKAINNTSKKFKDMDAGLRETLRKGKEGTRKVSSGFEDVSNKAGQAGRSIGRIGGNMGVLTASIGSIKTGWIAIAASVYATTRAVGEAVKTTAEFDDNVRKAAAVTGDFEGTFNELSKAAKEAGASTAFTASQAAEGLQFLTQAGLDAQTAIKALPTVLDLASAGSIDLGRSADIVTNIMSQMGIEVKDLSKTADILTKTFTSSNTNLEELGYAFSYVGPIAKSVGLDINDVSSILAVLANNGFKGERAGTGLRGALTRLLNPSKEAARELGKLNVNLKDGDGNTRKFTDILGDLQAAGIKTSQVMKIFGSEAGTSMQALINTGTDSIKKQRDALENLGDLTKKVAGQKEGGIGGSLRTLASGWESVKIASGEAMNKDLLSIIEDITAALRNNKEEVASLAGEFSHLLRETHNVIGVFVSLGGVLSQSVKESYVDLSKEVDNLAGKAGILDAAFDSANLTALIPGLSIVVKKLREYGAELAALRDAQDDAAENETRIIKKYNDKVDVIGLTITKTKQLKALGNFALKLDDSGNAKLVADEVNFIVEQFNRLGGELDSLKSKKIKEILPGDLSTKLKSDLGNVGISELTAAYETGLVIYDEATKKWELNEKALKSLSDQTSKTADDIGNITSAEKQQSELKNQNELSNQKDIERARLGMVQARIEAEKNLNRESFGSNSRDIKIAYDQQLLTDKEFIQAKLELKRDAINKEIDLLKRQLGGASDVDKIKIGAEIKINQSKLDDALRDAATQASKISRDTANKLSQIEIQTGDIDAQIAEIEKKYKGLIQNLKDQGNDEGATAIEKLVDVESAKVKMAALEDEYSQHVARLRAAEASINLSVKEGTITRIQAEEQIKIKYVETASELDKIIPKLQQTASVIGEDEVIKVQGLTNEVRNLNVEANKTAGQFASVFQGSFSDVFAELKDGISSAGDVFRNFAKSVLDGLAQILTKKIALQAADSATSAIGGLGGFGSFVSGLFGSAHTGGIAGHGNGVQIRANPAVFLGAPHYHAGGIAGLKPNEVPTILERGEEVLTANDPRHRNNDSGGGGQSASNQIMVKIINAVHPDMISEWANSSDGTRAIINVIENNPSVIKEAVS